MTVSELRLKAPKINFIKTKWVVDKPVLSLLKEAFIPDDDMNTFPSIESGTRIYPLSITEYPSVLKRMTAMEAGVWAIEKCHSEGWAMELDNFQCCLANLEMDM